MPTKPIGPFNSEDITWIPSKIAQTFSAGQKYSKSAILTILAEDPDFLITQFGFKTSDGEASTSLFLVGMKNNTKTSFCAPPCPPYCTNPLPE